MTIAEQIDADLKAAMKAKEAEKLQVLRAVKSAIKSYAIDKGGPETELSEVDVIGIIRKQIKQREDSIAGYEKGGRPELAAKEQAEIEMLQVYLPKPLSAKELEKEVKAAIKETGASSQKEMGQVVKLLRERIGDRVDGKTLSEEVKKQLA